MEIQKAKKVFYLSLVEREKISILRIINFIIEDLEFELSTRTGYSELEYRDLEKKIVENATVRRTFNSEEILMIHQAFNEVCHGIRIRDFNGVIGLEEPEAEKLFDCLDDFIK